MRTARITIEIRPKGLWRIDAIAATPDHGFPTRRHDCSHTRRQRIIWERDKKGLVILDRVALNRCGVGVRCIEFADGSAAQCGRTVQSGRLWRIRRPFEENKIAFQTLRVPRDFRAFRQLVDAQPHALE